MPIYEFYCRECMHKFEVLFRMLGLPNTHPCPSCGEPAPRELSTFNFNFDFPTSDAYDIMRGKDIKPRR